MKSAQAIENFLERAGGDERLLPSHFSLFLAIFHHSGEDAHAPFSVSRRKLMAHSRLGSTATYHKRISELAEFGYISYAPSFDPILASTIKIVSGDAG